MPAVNNGAQARTSWWQARVLIGKNWEQARTSWWQARVPAVKNGAQARTSWWQARAGTRVDWKKLGAGTQPRLAL